MGKPVILAVDDEPQVLNSVVRDLRKKYGEEYRVINAGSGKEALEAVTQLKQRDELIALFLVDQRMPDMTGTEFLGEARKLYRESRKVLLTAYADTEAAITSINAIELDYYLMKPWDPPEENLYPVLDDLLSDWWVTVPVPYDGIRVAGTLWSANSHAVKDFLSRNRIPYLWMDIERDAEARSLVEAVNEEGEYHLPVVFFPNGDVLVEPDNLALAEKAGLHTEASEPFYDLVIVGGGPAGLGAGVYGASEGLRTVLVEKEATGGQAGTSSRIENYLGFPKGLSGAELAKRATDQAIRLGCEILTAREVVGVRLEDKYKVVSLNNGDELTCQALIIATGVTIKRLDAPGVDELTGAGIYYGAALTEAPNYEGQHVFVVGGANSAGQAAMYFSRYAKQVSILVRDSSISNGMSAYLVDQIEEQENIEVLTRTVVAGVKGKQHLEEISYKNLDDDKDTAVPAGALFIFIGQQAHTVFLGDFIERNPAGLIVTGSDLARNGEHPQGWKLKRDPFMLETNIPGIFAVGDVRQGSVHRVASAVGQGAIAISLVHQYLKTV